MLAFLDWIRDQRDRIISGYPLINIQDFPRFRLRKAHSATVEDRGDKSATFNREF